MAEGKTTGAKLTYRQLDQALTALGFVRRQTDEYTVYQGEAWDALIVLPVMDARTVVGEPHLIAIRNTLLGKGVASQAEVGALLRPGLPQKAKGEGTRPPAKRQRRGHEAIPQTPISP